MQKFPYLRQVNIVDKFVGHSSKIHKDSFDIKTIWFSYKLKWPGTTTACLVLFPLLALFLWSISLHKISLHDMNGLGLVSVLSPGIIIALGILVVCFILTLQQIEVRAPLLAFQIICIIIILYTTPHLLEEAPRFTPVYRHAGYTDYIMQTGTVDPYLDIYFNWPGFFILNAFLTKAFGYSTILSFADWAPVFYNLMYIGPIYIIFTSLTTNKRIVWLSLLFFELTNWVGQDYFSPQGLNFFLYLVIIMILLKWFRVPAQNSVLAMKNASLRQRILAWFKTPDPQFTPLGVWQRRGLLCCLILTYGLMIISHPLTPFFTLLSVFALVLFRRCYPFWLPILMTVMTIAWIALMAQPYLSTHRSGIFGGFGNVPANIPQSIASGQMKEYQLYAVIAKMRLSMTLLLWFGAFLGCIKRWRQGNQDIAAILLAVTGFLLIAAQDYGGEMPMRIYFFTEPFMCFFTAALFFDNFMPLTNKLLRTDFLWKTAIIMATSLLLLGSFFFTRYGDEDVDFISFGEWNAVQYLYQIAPANSLLIEAWDDAPLYFKDYSKYKIDTLSRVFPEAVVRTNADEIVQFFQDQKNPNSFILFSREEQIHANSWDGLPDNALQKLEAGLLQTGKFKLIYSNSDAQVLQFIR